MKPQSIVPGLAMALTLGIGGVALSSPTASGASPGLPLLATGTITFPAGASTGQVLVFADPNQATLKHDTDGAPLTVHLVASANAASDGSFTLTLDPATLPANTVQPDGSVNL